MTLHHPESQVKSFGALNFSVFTTTSAPPAWDVIDSVAPGELDWQRASCYLAYGDKAHATEWFRAAYSADPGNERFRDKLIELYFDQQKYTQAVDLYSRGGLSDSTDEQTIVRLAESFAKLGDLPRSVAVMESGTTLHPNSAPLLMGLADYYRKTGNLDKAAAAERKRKQIVSGSPAS